MNDTKTTRADAIAGLQNLIHLLKTHPDLPADVYLSAQYSVLHCDRDASGRWVERNLSERIAEGERVARVLGLELGGTDDHRVARLALGGGVQYVVSVAPDREPADADDEPAEVAP